MFSDISKFLEKFSKKVDLSDSNKDKIIEIIKKEVNFEVTKENIEIKDSAIYLRVSPGLRNQIFINKSKIIEEIAKETTLPIVEIRF